MSEVLSDSIPFIDEPTWDEAYSGKYKGFTIPALKNGEVDLEPLRLAIRHYKMIEIWGSSVSELSVEERKSKYKSRALEARDIYVRLMTSINNNSSLDYRDWAIKTALRLRSSNRHTAQAIGGKHWQSWGNK